MAQHPLAIWQGIRAGILLAGLLCAPQATLAQRRTDALATVAELQPNPLSVDSVSFDFGEVRMGTMVRHTFRLHNRGTAPVVIRQVRTSCGCTTSQVNLEAVPPGASTPLEVLFFTGGRLGPQVKTIEVLVTDAHPLVLRLTGVVVSPVLPLTTD